MCITKILLSTNDSSKNLHNEKLFFIIGPHRNKQHPMWSCEQLHVKTCRLGDEKPDQQTTVHTAMKACEEEHKMAETFVTDERNMTEHVVA